MDPQAFVTALPATGPHPNHEQELMLFGSLVGEWRVRIHMIQDGEIRYNEDRCLPRILGKAISGGRERWPPTLGFGGARDTR
jgi:hypothetical protein